MKFHALPFHFDQNIKHPLYVVCRYIHAVLVVGQPPWLSESCDLTVAVFQQPCVSILTSVPGTPLPHCTPSHNRSFTLFWLLTRKEYNMRKYWDWECSSVDRVCFGCLPWIQFPVQHKTGWSSQTYNPSTWGNGGRKIRSSRLHGKFKASVSHVRPCLSGGQGRLKLHNFYYSMFL